MKELTVVILATNEEQRSILQMQVESTAIAEVTQTHATLPVSGTDMVVRRVQEARADVVLVEIPKESPTAAIRAIELLRGRLSHTTLFAVGDVRQSEVIIAAMRVGASEFLERPTTTTSLLEAFVRLTSAQRRTQVYDKRGKIFTFVNSKGGCGATTIAVNTALALHKLAGSVAIVDLALLGHVALHVNATPSFSVSDALRNLYRLDHALLATYMSTCHGLDLLASTTEPFLEGAAPGDWPRLFDLLTSHYQYIVVDASSRLDPTLKMVCDLSDTVLLVATPEVQSLWAAAQLGQHLGAREDDKIKLVINRFRRIPGFSEAEIETAVQAKIFGKIPNQYVDVSKAISRGIPVVLKNHSEISQSLFELASVLSHRQLETKRKSLLLFGRN